MLTLRVRKENKGQGNGHRLVEVNPDAFKILHGQYCGRSWIYCMAPVVVQWRRLSLSVLRVSGLMALDEFKLQLNKTCQVMKHSVSVQNSNSKCLPKLIIQKMIRGLVLTKLSVN